MFYYVLDLTDFGDVFLAHATVHRHMSRLALPIALLLNVAQAYTDRGILKLDNT